jgi:hypothetical protein
MPQKGKQSPGNQGYKGQGHSGTTRYPAESAPVVKNGGNEAIHDGVETSEHPHTPQSGSYGK